MPFLSEMVSDAYHAMIAHQEAVATGTDVQRVVIEKTPQDMSFLVMVLAIAVAVYVAFQIIKWVIEHRGRQHRFH